MLWKFNRFLPEKPCQTGTLAKTLLLMLIDVGLLAICVTLPPAPSVLQEGSPDACVYKRGSVRRASGFVLTGKPEVIRFEKDSLRLNVETLHGPEVLALYLKRPRAKSWELRRCVGGASDTAA
jgi:hypothetical protein